MKIKTSELIGLALDWAVAKCEGVLPASYDDWKQTWSHYSTNWVQGGPIIEREIHTLIKRDGVWEAECFNPKYPNPYRFCYAMKGSTLLIAAMRCYIASKLGAEVDVPEELL